MIIENIYINNNLFIEDDFINNQLSSKVGSLLNKETIKLDLSNIQKFTILRVTLMLITSSIENYSKDRVNLIFSINEGQSSKFQKLILKEIIFFLIVI